MNWSISASEAPLSISASSCAEMASDCAIFAASCAANSGGIGCRFSKVFRVDVFPCFLGSGRRLGRRDAGDIGSCDLIKRRIDLRLGRGFGGLLGKVDVLASGSKRLFCQHICDCPRSLSRQTISLTVSSDLPAISVIGTKVIVSRTTT